MTFYERPSEEVTQIPKRVVRQRYNQATGDGI